MFAGNLIQNCASRRRHFRNDSKNPRPCVARTGGAPQGRSLLEEPLAHPSSNNSCLTPDKSHQDFSEGDGQFGELDLDAPANVFPILTGIAKFEWLGTVPAVGLGSADGNDAGVFERKPSEKMARAS